MTDTQEDIDKFNESCRNAMTAVIDAMNVNGNGSNIRFVTVVLGGVLGAIEQASGYPEDVRKTVLSLADLVGSDGVAINA